MATQVILADQAKARRAGTTSSGQGAITSSSEPAVDEANNASPTLLKPQVFTNVIAGRGAAVDANLALDWAVYAFPSRNCAAAFDPVLTRIKSDKGGPIRPRGDVHPISLKMRWPPEATK